MNLQEYLTPLVPQIRRLAEEYAPKQADLLERFAKMDSETNDIPANEAVAELVLEHLEGLNASIEKHFCPGVGTHIIARIIPQHPTGKLIINSHLDTVFPRGYAEKFPPHREGDRLYGLGVTDCKGGFAVSNAALRIACELGLLPNKEIVMIYACDEEQGSVTGQEIYRREAAGAELAFVFEGGKEQDGKIGLITSRKGVLLGSLDITGVEAHAGSAYLQGHSAVKELAHKILELYSFNNYERGIFYNAAPVQGGRPNGVVAGSARMEFCVAGIPDRAGFAEVEANLKKLGEHVNDPACGLKLQYRTLFPALERTETASRAVALAAEAGRALGLSVEEIGVESAGDANYFGDFGVPAIDAFGPLGGGIHTTEEWVHLPSLQQKTELFAAFLAALKFNEL